MKKYWQFRSNFSVCDNLLLFGTRIVVPASRNTTKDSPRPPRLPKMLIKNINISSVDRCYSKPREVYQRVSYLSTNNTASKRASPPYIIMALGGAGHLFVPPQWYQLYIASRLLLSVRGSSDIVEYYFSRCHIIFLKAMLARHGIPCDINE